MFTKKNLHSAIDGVILFFFFLSFFITWVVGEEDLQNVLFCSFVIIETNEGTRNKMDKQNVDSSL